MNADLRASYDESPYRSRPLRQTHPDHLAMVASLFGLEAKGIERARVLEIGCAAGGNLLPMAACYPDSDFVGIDFSAVEIDQGNADVAAARLANARLLAMDVMDFDESQGEFDYIIAHGIYSWVPATVQARILEVCARHLSPKGIALVSFNTLPGWRMLGIIRDAMLFATRGIANAKARVAQARATLDFMSAAVTGEDSANARLLRLAAENLRQKPDYYVLHEYLEEANEALYFHEFIARTAPHGLRYLGDADVRTMLSSGLAQDTAQTLLALAPDLQTREQTLDFLRNRAFRHTLLIRDGVALDRKVSPARVLTLGIAALVQNPYSPSDLRANDRMEFTLADGRKLATPHPICKAALMTLAEESPSALPFAELYARAAALLGIPATDERQRNLLATEILRWFVADAVELHSSPSPFARRPAPRPQATAFARLQASRDAPATNLRHEQVALDDNLRRLIPLLDGSRSHEDLAGLGWPDFASADRDSHVRQALAAAAAKAFLMHPPAPH